MADELDQLFVRANGAAPKTQWVGMELANKRQLVDVGRMTVQGRGCVKTRLLSNFEDPSTPGESDKIDPGAIWRVVVSLNTPRAAFSHGLGRQSEFATKAVSCLSKREPGRPRVALSGDWQFTLPAIKEPSIEVEEGRRPGRNRPMAVLRRSPAPDPNEPLGRGRLLAKEWLLLSNIAETGC
jgi:hypothetical protein